MSTNDPQPEAIRARLNSEYHALRIQPEPFRHTIMRIRPKLRNIFCQFSYVKIDSFVNNSFIYSYLYEYFRNYFALEILQTDS